MFQLSINTTDNSDYIEVEVEVEVGKEKLLKLLAKAIHDKIMNVIHS